MRPLRQAVASRRGTAAMRITLSPDESVLFVVNGIPIKIGCTTFNGERRLYVRARIGRTKKPEYIATTRGDEAELSFKENQ